MNFIIQTEQEVKKYHQEYMDENPSADLAKTEEP
jgi:hypothetical protein